MILLPPFLRFYTYESSHFIIHYHKEIEGVVVAVSEIADSIYEEYRRIFDYDPGKINLVLIDIYDYSNGFSTPIYENTIYIYLQSPFADFYNGFGSMRSWIESVISHELVHIFHLDYPHDIRGFPLFKIMRRYFGRSPNYAFPNIYDPLWQLEGLATYFESRNGFGRLNSGLYKNLLLAYISKHNLTPDLMSNINDTWLGGLLPYVLGGFFTEYLAKKYGEDYVINRYVKSSYFEDLLYMFSLGFKGLWLKSDGKDFKEFISVLRRKSKDYSHPDYAITTTGFYKFSPTISESGRYMAYVENTNYDYPSLVVWDLYLDKEILRYKSFVLPSLHFEGDSVIYFSKHEYYRNFYIYSDIYAWNLKSGRILRITEGERAFSPYKFGDTLFYVRRKGVRQEIVMRYKDKTEVVLSGDVYVGFNNLYYRNDTLYFSINEDGRYDIGFYALDYGIFGKITDDDAVDILSYVDSTSIYFVRDEGDGYQIYIYRGGRFFKSDRVFFSALYPRPYKGRILAVFLTSEGYDIGMADVEFQEREIIRSETSKGRLPMLSLKPVSHPYNPLLHIFPKYWEPYMSIDYLSDTLILANLYTITSNWDVLYRHIYSIGTYTNIRIQGEDTSVVPGGYLDYLFTGFYPFVGFRLSMDVYGYYEFMPYIRFPIFGFRSYKDITVIGIYGTMIRKIGFSFTYSNAFSYKTSGTLAEGFLINPLIMYGDSGWEFYINSSAGAEFGPMLLNFEGSFARTDRDTFQTSIYLYPNIYKPWFPDMNIGILPPRGRHFFPILFLLRVYPGVFYDLEFGFGTLIAWDMVLLGKTPITLYIGYSLYPKRKLVLKVR